MGYKLDVDVFGSLVRAETDGYLVSLNDLFAVGNAWRLHNKKAALQLTPFLKSEALKAYVSAASNEWGIPEDKFIIKVGKGKYTRTMAHISVAVLAAEQISPEFHAKIHKIFIEGELMKYRVLGGTEFVSMNIAIDTLLPDRVGKDNKGVFIQCAKMIRTKVLNVSDGANVWASATVEQTHQRYAIENKIVDYLKLGFIRDYAHLKEVIGRL